MFRVSVWRGSEFCLGVVSLPKPPRGDGTMTLTSMLRKVDAAAFLSRKIRIGGASSSLDSGKFWKMPLVMTEQ